jgi:hypothetical protein
MNKFWTDVLVRMLFKFGVLGEFRNVETTIDMPDSNGRVTVKSDLITIRFQGEPEVIQNGSEKGE